VFLYVFRSQSEGTLDTNAY